MTVNFSLKFIAEFYCICTPLFMLYTITDIDLQNDSYFPKGGFCNGVWIDLTVFSRQESSVCVYL